MRVLKKCTNLDVAGENGVTCNFKKIICICVCMWICICICTCICICYCVFLCVCYVFGVLHPCWSPSLHIHLFVIFSKTLTSPACYVREKYNILLYTASFVLCDCVCMCAFAMYFCNYVLCVYIRYVLYVCICNVCWAHVCISMHCFTKSSLGGKSIGG